jgi:hypothetical protein
MKYPQLMQSAALAMTLGAGCASAQTASVATDAAPPPAEDRGSAGAIVLENSLVRAQRENAFQKSSSRNGVATMGRDVLRATLRAKADADLAQAREAQSLELQRMGAGGAPK